MTTMTTSQHSTMQHKNNQCQSKHMALLLGCATNMIAAFMHAPPPAPSWNPLTRHQAIAVHSHATDYQKNLDSTADHALTDAHTIELPGEQPRSWLHHFLYQQTTPLQAQPWWA
jgi:hypothetical protein